MIPCLFRRGIAILFFLSAAASHGMTFPQPGVVCDSPSLPSTVAGPPPPPAEPKIAGKPTTLIIVRHAEKDTAGTDPHLSEAGKRRAEYLSRLLLEMHLDGLIASPRVRTRETLAPIAALRDLPVTVISLEGGKDGHVAELLDTVRTRYNGQTVLVASHSDVIPVLLKGLGIGGDITLGDDEYDNLFIVTAPFQDGGISSMVRLRIGMP